MSSTSTEFESILPILYRRPTTSPSLPTKMASPSLRKTLLGELRKNANPKNLKRVCSAAGWALGVGRGGSGEGGVLTVSPSISTRKIFRPLPSYFLFSDCANCA